MAVLMSAATGNLTASGTWGLVDATSYLNSETGSEILTTAYSGTRSSTFTPGAITIDGIAVKLSVRTGTTGTISVSLYNDTLTADVAGTEVTINCSDLQPAVTASLNGGWIFFKFAAPVLLLTANAYRVQAKTSSASQISLFRDGTTDNLARALRTTTNQAPTTGDDMIVIGEYTGAGTANVLTVTMDSTAATDYGAASTSLVLPALAIGAKGTLDWGTTAATNYILKVSGNAIVYDGGTHNIGTTGTPIPRDSTALLQFDCGANVDFGHTVRNGGTSTRQGLSRTSGKNIVFCKLNTDESVNSTSLGVDTDTGWLDNDEIAIASTSKTIADCENGTLNGNAGASTLTVDGFAGAGGGLAAAHLGTSPIQAEIILLTRNIVVRGASATLQAFEDIKALAVIDYDWVEFKWLGSATSNKRGIDVATTTGSFNMQYCSTHDFTVASSVGVNVASASGSNIVYSNNGSYNHAIIHVVNTATTGVQVYDNNIGIKTTGAGNTMFSFNDVGSTYTNITGVSNTGVNNPAIAVTEVLVAASLSPALGTCNNLTAHSCGGVGVSIGSNSDGPSSGTVSNIISYRNNTHGLLVGGTGVTIDTVSLFGNTSGNLSFSLGGGAIDAKIINLTADAGTTLTATIGINFPNQTVGVTASFYNCSFGATTAHSTGDMSLGSNIYAQLKFYNCLFASTTEINAQSSLMAGSFIASQKHDQTAGLHKTWKGEGTIDIETTIVHTGAHSMRMLPLSASEKLVSSSFFVAVANGATLTPSVYVRESAAYNGNRCRLIVKKNVAIGITADTVLDTRTGASDAVFEQMTGTTAAATDDGVMEFVIDADNTAATGYVYIDSFTCA